jgi:hypothetical protein
MKLDKALAARKDELENVKIRSCLSLRPRAVIEGIGRAESGTIVQPHAGFDQADSVFR